MDHELIEHFATGGEKLQLAIRGLTREDLLQVPEPDAGVGKWSIQQLVIHCLDSELVSIDRLKRMIAEENPTLIGYDENKYTQALFYSDQPAQPAANLVDANRELFAHVLRKLPDTAWTRKGTHNERGEINVGGYLKAVVDHLEHHIHFIHLKRAKMGKEMW